MKLQNVGSSLRSTVLAPEPQSHHLRNCWDPRTWADSFEPAKAPQKALVAMPSFVAPSAHEPIEMYMSIAAQAMDSGKAIRVTDVAQLGTLQKAHETGNGHDITPPHTSDNDQTMFVVDGRIFVRVVGFAGPKHAQWYEVDAPKF
jgi:hypothetical protein